MDEKMSTETKETLLYGHLHEDLFTVSWKP